MNSPEIISILHSRYISMDDLSPAPRQSTTAATTPSRREFKTIKLGKMKLNSKQQVNSAKIFINKNKIIIKNLSKLEPLSHLVDEDKLSSLLQPHTTKEYTTLSHLKINKKNVTEENFLIKPKKPKKKPIANSRQLSDIYKEQPIDKGFRIKTVTSQEDPKTRKKVIKHIANLKKITVYPDFQ